MKFIIIFFIALKLSKEFFFNKITVSCYLFHVEECDPKMETAC